MSLDLGKIFRDAAAVIDGVTASAQVDVTHEAWISQDGYAKPTYADAVTIKAAVGFAQKARRMPDGSEAVQTASILIPRPVEPNGATGRREPIDLRDRLTLPSGYTGEILDVTGPGVDPLTNRPYALKVILGERR